LPRIIFTVTNDLVYDQRMNRIANSMVKSGYQVLLIGRKLSSSQDLLPHAYQQKRIRCLFNRGSLFYAEYNLRLFCCLLFQQADIFCAIDLDTILAVYFASVLRNKKRVYDAHELFTEQKEIITRPFIQKIWLQIEKFSVPKFTNGYTVNAFIADEFKKRYGVSYTIIRNLPVLFPVADTSPDRNEKWIIYQGAVNQGRSFETLIPAMQHVNARLVICGKGNFYEQTRQLISHYTLDSKIELRGYISPENLHILTPEAYIGITLFEPEGLNQYHSLANRFFDYMMAGIPQVCVNYPEYAAVNEQYGIAYMIPDCKADTIAHALNKLLNDTVIYNELATNCIAARSILNWEEEEKILVNFYKYL